jgi:hypothetical protein
MVAKKYSKKLRLDSKDDAHSLHIPNMTHHDGSKFMEKNEKRVKKEAQMSPWFFAPRKSSIQYQKCLLAKAWPEPDLR